MAYWQSLKYKNSEHYLLIQFPFKLPLSIMFSSELSPTVNIRYFLNNIVYLSEEFFKEFISQDISCFFISRNLWKESFCILQLWIFILQSPFGVVFIKVLPCNIPRRSLRCFKYRENNKNDWWLIFFRALRLSGLIVWKIAGVVITSVIHHSLLWPVYITPFQSCYSINIGMQMETTTISLISLGDLHVSAVVRFLSVFLCTWCRLHALN